MVTARIISAEDNRIVQHTVESSKVASHVLEKISASLEGGTGAKFDSFLSILENQMHDDSLCTSLVEQIRKDLLKSPTGTL